MRFGSCGETKLTSRLGNEITAVYRICQGVLADALTGRAGIFDGELVMLGSAGRPDFHLMQFPPPARPDRRTAAHRAGH